MPVDNERQFGVQENFCRQHETMCKKSSFKKFNGVSK